MHDMDGSKLGVRRPVKELQQSGNTLNATSFVLVVLLALAPAMRGSRCNRHVVDPNKPWTGMQTL